MTSEAEPPTDDLTALTALSDPTRRSVYESVVAADDWVSRDQVAEAAGLERGTAAHHLDRLASEGLLQVEFRRLSGRQGPGAGRPAKLYKRAERDFSVALPQREYEVVGRILARAVDQVRLHGADINAALSEAASAEGTRIARDLGNGETPAGKGDDPGASSRKVLMKALVERGYEPSECEDGTVVSRNCPFHHLAKDHTELVCQMNLCLLSSTLEELKDQHFEAHLEPESGLCCVRLRPRG